MRMLKMIMISVISILIFSYPAQTVWSGTTERVSISSDGEQVNLESFGPLISPDGRFVAFTSSAENLVPGDTNGEDDVFVHDRQTGQTTRVSVSSDGEQANSRCYPRTPISSDGRFVAFFSRADNLVPGDTNDENDVFVHDRQTGQTTRVSVSSDGEQVNKGGGEPSMSSDGRFVAFDSWDDNLVPGDTNDAVDIFVHDRQTGQTTIVSVNSDGEQGNGYCAEPNMSSDGRFVAFKSDADNLVSGDTNDAMDIFVHDRQIGQTTRVNVNSDGEQAGGADLETISAISADGRFVTFASGGGLVPGYDDGIFVHDRQTGQTTIVSVNSGGEQADEESYHPSISPDGRFVAFLSEANNLVPGDTNGEPDTFVHDRQTGQTTRVSVSSDGEQGNGSSGDSSLSSDGRFVAFESDAENLVTGDTNGRTDVFVHERSDGDLSTNVFSPSFDDTSTWADYKDTDNKDTKVVTFADGGDPGEKYKVVVRTTTGDRINYIFTSKGSGYTGCDKSAYGDEWPGFRRIDLRPNSGFARLLKMKMVRRSGAGARQAYVGFLGSGDQGWDQTSGPADACGWLATCDSDDAFLLDETDDVLTFQTDLTVDGQTMVGQIEEPDLHVSYNVFSPRFDDTSTWAVYKDTNYKDTRVITFADAGAPGEKYKVVIKTTTGDTINYIFTSKGSGYTGCDRSAYDGEWPGYRKIVLGSNAGYAKLLKMKMIKSSGTGFRSAYVGFFGRGEKGWTQTSGPADGCGW